MIKYDVPLNLDDGNNLDKLIKRIKPNTYVLEFGPSTGRLTKYMQEQLHCNVYGVEIDEHAFLVCKKYLIDGMSGDLETYEWMERFQGLKFDYVIFADVLEHLKNPQLAITNIKSFMNEHAQVLVSVPNIAHNSIIIELLQNRFNYTSTGLLDNTHIHFFTKETCLEMFTACGYFLSYSDGTTAEPYNTEIRNSFNGFPEEVSEYLGNRDYGNLYQIIYAFQLEKPDVVNDQLQNCRYRQYFAKIYMDTGEGFQENQIILKEVVLKETSEILIEREDLLQNTKRIGVILLDNFYGECSMLSVLIDQHNHDFDFDTKVVVLDNQVYLDQQKLVIATNDFSKINIKYHIDYCSHTNYAYALYKSSLYNVNNEIRFTIINQEKKMIQFAKSELLKVNNIESLLRMGMFKNRYLNSAYRKLLRLDGIKNIKIAVVNIMSTNVEYSYKQCQFSYFNEFPETLDVDYVIVRFHDAQIDKAYFLRALQTLKQSDYDALYSDCISPAGRDIYKTDYSYEYIIQKVQEFDVLFVDANIYNIVMLIADDRNINTSYEFMLLLTKVTEIIGHISVPMYKLQGSNVVLNTEILTKIENNALFKYGKDLDYVEKIDEQTSLLHFRYLKENKKIAIIIPMKDKADLSDACIKSILKISTYTNYEIIILNNNSEDKETFVWFDVIQRNANVKVIDAAFDFNWSKLNNFGIQNSNADAFIFLNNDTLIITPDWMQHLVNDALRPDSGIVGALLLYDDNTIQHAGVVLGMNDFADHIFKQEPLSYNDELFVAPLAKRNVLAVTGACMAISRKTLDKIGLFNDTFIICGSDVEICLRAYKQGLKNIYNPYARLYHLESKSRDSYIPPIDFEMSIQHYAPYREQGDPYFNKNLSKKHTTPKKRGT